MQKHFAEFRRWVFLLLLSAKQVDSTLYWNPCTPFLTPNLAFEDTVLPLTLSSDWIMMSERRFTTGVWCWESFSI